MPRGKYTRKKRTEAIVDRALRDKDIGLCCMFCQEVIFKVKQSALRRSRDPKKALKASEVVSLHGQLTDPDRVCISCPYCWEDIFEHNPKGGYNVYPHHLQIFGEKTERYPTVDGASPGLYLVKPYSADPNGTCAALVREALYGLVGF